MSFSDGPFIQAACFCNMVLEDTTGVLSLIRIVDTVTHTQSGPNPPEDLPPFNYSVKLVLMIKAGTARGRFNLKLVQQKPDGSAGEPLILTIHLEGEEKGQNVVSDLNASFDMEGLYWFNVYLDDMKLTAIPMRIRYNRVVTTSGSKVG